MEMILAIRLLWRDFIVSDECMMLSHKVTFRMYYRVIFSNRNFSKKNRKYVCLHSHN